MGDAEDSREFTFEVTQSPQAWGFQSDVIERPGEQVVKRGIRMFGFHHGFKELAAVAGEQGGGVVSAQAFTPVTDGNLPQSVQFTSSGLLEGDFSAKKRSSWPAKGLFGRRAPLATVFSKPKSSAIQWAIKLVSVSRVRRMRMARVDCMVPIFAISTGFANEIL